MANGRVTAETLVGREVMAVWQKAGDIPGLPAGASGPPSIAQGGGPPVIAGGYGGGALWIDFGVLEFTWRSIVVLMGVLFIIPAPWVLVWYLKWIVTCVHVPGRPNLTFTGSALTVGGWDFWSFVLAVSVA